MTELTFTKKQTLFIWLLTLHSALLIASNAAGAKMIRVTDHLAASATVFSYSATFLIIAIIVEFFGRQAAKLTIAVGLAALVLSVAFFSIAIAAPPAAFWHNQAAYQSTLGPTLRMLVGGWVAYLCSQMLDVAVFWIIRKVTNGKYLWLRALGSMVVSQFFDTVIFMTITFYGMFPLMDGIMGQYLLKVVIAVTVTPLMYLVAGLIKRRQWTEAVS